MNEYNNGLNEPSLTILIINKGIHPIGEVFLIINDKVINIVNINKFLF